MIVRSMFAVVLALVVALCSCAKNQVESDDQLLGEWQMLDDPSKGKRIRLDAEGNAQFIRLQAENVGIESKGALPVKGSWMLLPDGEVLRFRFVMNGATYDHSGKLVRKRDSLELRFGVGDPDDFTWKRFRLEKPKAD